MNETDIMREIMHQAPKKLGRKARLFRNNVGLFTTYGGGVIRTGLGKGSSDIIGWTSVIVEPDMLGKRVAVFTACEVKRPGKKLTDSQKNFLFRVQEVGGIGILAEDPDDLTKALEDFYLRF